MAVHRLATPEFFLDDTDPRQNLLIMQFPEPMPTTEPNPAKWTPTHRWVITLPMGGRVAERVPIPPPPVWDDPADDGPHNDPTPVPVP